MLRFLLSSGPSPAWSFWFICIPNSAWSSWCCILMDSSSILSSGLQKEPVMVTLKSLLPPSGPSSPPWWEIACLCIKLFACCVAVLLLYNARCCLVLVYAEKYNFLLNLYNYRFCYKTFTIFNSFLFQYHCSIPKHRVLKQICQKLYGTKYFLFIQSKGSCQKLHEGGSPQCCSALTQMIAWLPKLSLAKNCWIGHQQPNDVCHAPLIQFFIKRYYNIYGNKWKSCWSWLNNSACTKHLMLLILYLYICNANQNMYFPSKNITLLLLTVNIV